jgi:heat shock protein HslJ
MKLSRVNLGGLAVALVMVWVTMGGTALANKTIPDAELTNTYWRAVEIDGQPVTLQPRQREPHFVLTKDNRMHGYTGCNRVLGSYERTTAGLKFKQLVTTRRACPPPESAMEASFQRALNATVSYQLSGNNLALLDAKGRVRLRLKAQYLK